MWEANYLGSASRFELGDVTHPDDEPAPPAEHVDAARAAAAEVARALGDEYVSVSVTGTHHPDLPGAMIAVSAVTVVREAVEGRP